MQISSFGAISGLAFAVFLILRKYTPVYSLMVGALIGGLLGGAGISETVNYMMLGVQDVTPAILRILGAGVLVGVLIESGAAEKISETIIEKFGEEKALFSLALATLILTGIGIFVDVAVITVSPIAIGLAKRLDLSKISVLLAMVGGGKAGNIISPNPNTIYAAESFGVSLPSLMGINILPAVLGLITTCLLAGCLKYRGEKVGNDFAQSTGKRHIHFWAAVAGPVVAISLLVLRSFTGLDFDPLIALPVGGVIGCAAMGRMSNFKSYIFKGLNRMVGVAVLLIGTGTLSGIIKNSNLKEFVLLFAGKSGLPEFFLAPFSGALMSAATASTSAGVAVASATFSGIIISSGVKALYGAAMMHAGATVFDHLPHGSFFHATAGSTSVESGERLKLIPYETAVGLAMSCTSMLVYLFVN